MPTSRMGGGDVNWLGKRMPLVPAAPRPPINSVAEFFDLPVINVKNGETRGGRGEAHLFKKTGKLAADKSWAKAWAL